MSQQGKRGETNPVSILMYQKECKNFFFNHTSSDKAVQIHFVKKKNPNYSNKYHNTQN